MSKVLGFTNNGGEDWFVSSEYGNKEIQGIPDPEGGHSLNAPTAVPSPFARMDLVRKSLENIVESPSLTFLQSGSKVIVSKDDTRAVSQCLDLAEILFFHNNYKTSIEIVEWNKSTQINTLKKSEEIGHKRLGEVLELYLLQDREAFNFDLMTSIYLIKYNHQIIGGTSPLTMFFSTAKDISSLDLRSSSGKIYFRDVVPLYERDESFQKYIYLLFKVNPKLRDKMRSFQEYLNKSLQFLASTNSKFYSELNLLNVEDLNANYIELNTREAGQVVEVLGVALRTVDPNDVVNSIKKSDFVIHSTKYKGDKKPLVLQNNFNKDLRYIKAGWECQTSVPYKDPVPLFLRKLPGQDFVFPYLTVSDFLEAEIIRLVYPINSDRFFAGNFKSTEVPEVNKSYLLPLKPFFFDFFDVEDLINGGIGKPQIAIDQVLDGRGVRVKLSIPINDGRHHVIFERQYHSGGNPDEVINKGTIREHQFGITVFPFIKHAESVSPYYNVQLIDRDVFGENSSALYNLRFYSNDTNQPVLNPHENVRSTKKKGDASKVSTKYYHLKQSFDYIQVDNGFSKGIIIPMWSTTSNTGKQFSFAIDFGTTNTHIEYSVDGAAPKVFEIGYDEIQAVPLLDDRRDHNFSGTGAIDIRTAIVKEFLPQIISSSTLHKFPHRTVIAQSKSSGPTQGGKTLVDFNIPFVFENTQDFNSTYFTNLKWDSNDVNNEYKVKAFLEQLILLMRNKVLINGGDISETKVVWTYPTSMSPARKNNLQRYWNDLYLKYFGSAHVPIDLPESIAPYYYFRGNAKLEGLGYGVSILMDIGGGTSDVVVYENNIPKLISSYKFAGSALFGDGYKEYANIGSNQLINRFKDDYLFLLKQNAPGFESIFQDIYENQSSADFNSFLFSLHTNNEIKNREVLNYSQKLASDSELKIIFLYFYCAKIYHIAKLMKASKMDLPTNLIFSGNGSKILDLITPNYILLSDLSKAIFLKVYNMESYIIQGLKINIEKQFPKEVTSKGALIHQKQGIARLEIEGFRRVFTALEDEGKVLLTYGDLNKDVIKKVVSQVEDFNRLFISLNNTFNFNRLFDVSHHSFSKFKEVVDNHLESYLLEGIEYNNRLDAASPQPDAPIHETLFFYPLVETLQQLIKELGQLKETT